MPSAMASSGPSTSTTPVPTPLSTLIKDRSALRSLSTLSLQLRRGQLRGPERVAPAIARALRIVVSTARFSQVDALDHILRAAGQHLQASSLGEQCITNITLRIIHLLHEEARALALEEGGEHPSASAPPSAPSTPLKPPGPQSISTNPLSPLAKSATAKSSNSSAPPPPAPSAPLDAANTSLSGGSSGEALISPPLSPPGIPPSDSRPGLSAFRGGSTYSISDLVVAAASGAGASVSASASSTSPSGLPTPMGSGANTPGRTGLLMSESNVGQLGTSMEALRLGSRTTTTLEEEEEEDEEEEEEEEEDDDDDDEDDNTADAQPSTNRSPKTSHLSTVPTSRPKSALTSQLKPLLIQSIQELLDELETSESSLARDAKDHVHSGEVILTLGYSSAVEAFLKSASKAGREFTVVVAEDAPSYSGHEMARRLSGCSTSAPSNVNVKANSNNNHANVQNSNTNVGALSLSDPKVHSLLVPDSSVFGLMPRISKVVLGAESILSNGGVLARAGSAMTAMAAREQATPIVVLGATYKISAGLGFVGRAHASIVKGNESGTAAGSGTGKGEVRERFGSSAIDLAQSANVGPANLVLALQDDSIVASPASASRTMRKGMAMSGGAVGGRRRGSYFDTPDSPPSRSELHSSTTRNDAHTDVDVDDALSSQPQPQPLDPTTDEARSLSQSDTDIIHPHFDYLPPSDIDILITNAGEHAPSLVYRLVKENYALALGEGE